MTTKPVNIETRIKEEQIRLSFRQLPFVVFLPPVSGALLAFLLWDQVDPVIISAWLTAVICGCTLLGGWLLWKYRKSDPNQNQSVWTHKMLTLSILGGGAWGLGGYILFTPESFGYLGLLFLWMYLPAACGTMVTIAYTPLFYSITTVMLLPLTVRCLVGGGILNLTLALTTVIYTGCLYYFHTHIHRMLMESVRLKFEKSDLLEEVTLRKEAAEHANIAKSRFLAAASHDLRQPLHAQTLFVAELKHRAKDPESKQLIKHMEASIESMSSLFSALLDISRLDAATVSCNIQECSMASLLDRLDIEFSAAAHDKGLKLHVAACKEKIYSDPALLARIFQNLVANAIQYTDSGSVMICCRNQGDKLRIEIRDSGPGIAQDKHEEIFEEFVQLHNQERDRTKGLGLGLAIVSRLGQLLKHEIHLRSAPGKGSTFSVLVPRYRIQPGAPPEKTQDTAHEPDISGIRILVIDNEASIRTGMQGVLCGWGCHAVTASGYDDAIETLDRETFIPQVIISDYRLPGSVTGIDTLDRLREHLACKVPGILITGDTASELIQEAFASGYHLLHKPILPKQLRTLITSVMEQSPVPGSS